MLIKAASNQWKVPVRFVNERQLKKCAVAIFSLAQEDTLMNERERGEEGGQERKYDGNRRSFWS